MSKLGNRQAAATIYNGPDGPFGPGFWRAVFDPRVFAVASNSFEIYHMAIKGPSGSSLQVYVDRDYYSSTSRGDLNEWDPNQPLSMLGGQTLYFYWNSAKLPAPFVTVWLQTSTPL